MRKLLGLLAIVPALAIIGLAAPSGASTAPHVNTGGVPVHQLACPSGGTFDAIPNGNLGSLNVDWESVGPCPEDQISPQVLDTNNTNAFGGWVENSNLEFVTGTIANNGFMSKGWVRDRYNGIVDTTLCLRVYPSVGDGWFNANSQGVCG